MEITIVKTLKQCSKIKKGNPLQDIEYNKACFNLIIYIYIYIKDCCLEGHLFSRVFGLL